MIKFTILPSQKNLEEGLFFECSSCQAQRRSEDFLHHVRTTHNTSEYEIDTAMATRLTPEPTPSQKVPLVIYRMGIRQSIGEAEVNVDSIGVHVTARITDPEIDARLRGPLGAISVGLIPPIALGNTLLTAKQAKEVLEHRPTKFSIEFHEPLFIDRPKYERDLGPNEAEMLLTNDAELPNSPYDYPGEDPNSPR